MDDADTGGTRRGRHAPEEPAAPVPPPVPEDATVRHSWQPDLSRPEEPTGRHAVVGDDLAGPDAAGHDATRTARRTTRTRTTGTRTTTTTSPPPGRPAPVGTSCAPVSAAWASCW